MFLVLGLATRKFFLEEVRVICAFVCIDSCAVCTPMDEKLGDISGLGTVCELVLSGELIGVFTIPCAVTLESLEMDGESVISVICTVLS